MSPAAPSLSSRPAHGAPAGEMAAARNGGNNDADHLGLVATRAAEAADEAATPLSLPLPPAADVAGTAAPPTAAAAKAIARQDSTAAATAETALRASHVLVRAQREPRSWNQTDNHIGKGCAK